MTDEQKVTRLKQLLPILGKSLYGQWWRAPMSQTLDIHPKSFMRWMHPEGDPPTYFNPNAAAKRIDRLFDKREQELVKARQQFAQWQELAQQNGEK